VTASKLARFDATKALVSYDLVAADIPTLDTSKVATGIFTVGRLGSGTATSSNWLRGDGAWTAITPAAIGAQAAGTYLTPSNVSGTNGHVARFSGTNTVTSDAGWRATPSSGITWRLLLDGSASTTTNTELVICGRNAAAGQADLTWGDGFYAPGTHTRRMTARWNSTADHLEIFSSDDTGTSRATRLTLPRSSAVPVGAYGGMTINQGAQEILQVQRGSNGVGALSGIDWQMLNSASAYANYGRIQARIESNTAGAQTGSMQFKIYNAGVETKIVDVLASGLNVAVGSVQIAGTNAITSSRGGVLTALTVGSTTGFVRSTAGVYAASALVAGDVPALDAAKITTGTFADARIASAATWNAKLTTVTADATSRTAKTFYAAPNAAAGTATFRAIVASDIPTLNQTTTGSAATLTTARTLTIGSTGKTFNGSANVAWTLAEIGAQPVENQRLSTTNSVTFGSVNASSGSIGNYLCNNIEVSELAGASAGILKAGTTGQVQRAIAADFPTLNQSTTGSAGSIIASNIFTYGTGATGTYNLTLANTDPVVFRANCSGEGSVILTLPASDTLGKIRYVINASAGTGACYVTTTNTHGAGATMAPGEGSCWIFDGTKWARLH
jgi:hypothetical protein